MLSASPTNAQNAKNVTRFMAKTTAKSVTRSCQKPNLVTFFAFLERCFEYKLAGAAEHILFMAKKMPKSVTKARSRQNQIWFFFCIFRALF
jgi:hypothetical protein